MWQEKREFYELERGDVLRVPAGVTVYLSNEEGSNQELSIAKLVLPVNVPGSFEVGMLNPTLVRIFIQCRGFKLTMLLYLQEFFLAGSEYPESYFGALSTEVLEASLNVSSVRILPLTVDLVLRLFHIIFCCVRRQWMR